MLVDEAALERTADEEAQLVQRAKERRLYRYCYARTGDEAVAAELASQVFLEALQGIDRYVYRGRPLLAWLYRIARNVVSDHLKRRAREARALQEAGALLEPHDPGPASQVGDRQDLSAALQRLTEDQQQVI